MDNVFKYYEFTDFFKDKSGAFLKNEISFSEVNSQHFLIFEKKKDTYNLYISKYSSKEEIGQKLPQILELLIENYDKSIPEHRVAIKKYLI